MQQSPAIEAFVSGLEESVSLGQLRITRHGSAFSVCHEQDATDAAELESIPVSDLRRLADHTSAGNYRPLKSVPNLRTGWRCTVNSPAELEQALNHLYPGAVADWHAPKTAGNITTYRKYTSRQTGMYRITTFLDDAATEQIVKACCAESLCLKQRHWDVDSYRELTGSKYSIPCLEPCPVLLEFARKAVRMSQEKQSTLQVSESEIETLLAVLADASAPADGSHREADFADPRNSRRQELLKNKLADALARLQEQPES